MVMGVFKVSVNDLKQLVKNVQKSVHGLTKIDVTPVDKMNYGSVQKIIEPRVIEALEKYVKNSEATIKYLKVCSDATSSFLDSDLAPLERIFRMWRSVYFLRIWRQFIMKSRTYTLKNNFITTNAYTCIEINARSLILLIKKFRDQNTPEQFLSILFDSQSCERAFRQFRSMGTAQYTKINFSLYELLFMIGRVEVQNDISYLKLARSGISFPNKRMGKTTIYPLPTDDEIDATVKMARELAIEEAAVFGMTDLSEIDDMHIHSNLTINENEQDFSDDEEDLNTDFEEDENSSFDVENAQNEEIAEDSSLIVVYDENGIKRVIRKATLLWMLCEPSQNLSNDRLRRFQINQGRKRKAMEDINNKSDSQPKKE